jgi:hypothetical protein
MYLLKVLEVKTTQVSQLSLVKINTSSTFASTRSTDGLSNPFRAGSVYQYLYTLYHKSMRCLCNYY